MLRRVISFSGQEDDRARRLAAFEIAVRLRGILQRVGVVHVDLHDALRDDVEQVVGVGQQILALGDVGAERRTRRIERPLRRQEQDVEVRDRARRVTEAHPQAERLEAVERARIRVLADGVIDHVAAGAARDLLHALHPVFRLVVDHVRGAVRLREFQFVGRAGRADDGRTEMLGPLAGDEADAARRRMHEERRARPDLVGLAQ